MVAALSKEDAAPRNQNWTHFGWIIFIISGVVAIGVAIAFRWGKNSALSGHLNTTSA
jgi:hypothetical protein